MHACLYMHIFIHLSYGWMDVCIFVFTKIICITYGYIMYVYMYMIHMRER